MTSLAVPGCRLIDFPLRGDDRGSLVAYEAATGLPFAIARAYTVFATTAGTRRGFHAHRSLNQMAVAVAGACSMLIDDGAARDELRLDRPDRALTIPPMVWHEMFDFTPDCVLLVLADAAYSEVDYIRRYEDFLAARPAA